MELKKILLFISVIFISHMTIGQDDVVSSGVCIVSFKAERVMGDPNTVNFYGYAPEIDPATGVIPVWYWDFGDGTTSGEQNPVHIFPAVDKDSFVVSLNYSLGSNCSVSHTEIIYMDGADPRDCYADFIWFVNDSVRLFAEGYPVSFIDLSGSDESTVIHWEWDFGDGYYSDEQNPMHIYQPDPDGNILRVYNVILKITTDNGCSSEISKIIYPVNVYFDDCQAYFSYGPAEDLVTIPEVIPVAFTDYSKGEVVSRLWDFGDGATSTEYAPVHMFDFLGGPYIVTLTVTTESGCVSTYSEYIRMGFGNDNCMASFYYTLPDTMIGIPELVPFQFFDISECDVIKRFWDFGDGSYSDEKSPVHNFYFEGGMYWVTLTILTSDGCESSYSDYIYPGGPIIEPVDTCYYYISVLTGENPLADGLCSGTASASLYDFNGNQVEADNFYWSTGQEGTSVTNLCFNTYYSVKTEAPNGCAVYSDFAVYNGSWIDSSMIVDPWIDWTTFNDSLKYYFNFPDALDSSWICVWDFGDGNTAEGVNVSHEFAGGGVYNVTLTIIDSTGVKVITRQMDIAGPTSVKNPSLRENFRIAPNPVDDEVILYHSNPAGNDLVISIMDNTGRLVYSGSNSNTLNNGKLTVPTHLMAPGTYFLRIDEDGGETTVLQFVKIK